MPRDVRLRRQSCAAAIITLPTHKHIHCNIVCDLWFREQSQECMYFYDSSAAGPGSRACTCEQLTGERTRAFPRTKATAGSANTWQMEGAVAVARATYRRTKQVGSQEQVRQYRTMQQQN
jgi:hypothetical protein